MASSSALSTDCKERRPEEIGELFDKNTKRSPSYDDFAWQQFCKNRKVIIRNVPRVTYDVRTNEFIAFLQQNLTHKAITDAGARHLSPHPCNLIYQTESPSICLDLDLNICSTTVSMLLSPVFGVQTSLHCQLMTMGKSIPNQCCPQCFRLDDLIAHRLFLHFWL